MTANLNLPGAIAMRFFGKFRVARASPGAPTILLSTRHGGGYVPRSVSGGVMVAQGPLEAFVMVQIHAGQPLCVHLNRRTITTFLLPKDGWSLGTGNRPTQSWRSSPSK